MKSLVLFFTALVGTCSVLAQSASLTFQGQLGDSGRPASGNYDFVFRLFDAAANGSEVALSFAAPNVVVTNGYFTAQVDFGANAFAGGARWVQVEVRTNGSVAAFSPLLPRQALGAVPYALYALNGSPGPQGPQGTLGPAGATGPQGSQGLLGLTGAAGPAGVVGPQGPKGLVFRGAWNPATSYVLDDAVASGGSAWLAKRGNSNITPIEGADWTLLSQKGDAGTAGPAGPQGLQGVTGLAGAAGSQGPQGIQGPVGLTGPQGAAGVADAQTLSNLARLDVPDTATQATAAAIVTAGFITGVTVTGQGNGYTTQPTITITDPAGSGAVLNPIISNSKLIGITVSSPGSGYVNPQVIIGQPSPYRIQTFSTDNNFTGNNVFNGKFIGDGSLITNSVTRFVTNTHFYVSTRASGQQLEDEVVSRFDDAGGVPTGNSSSRHRGLIRFPAFPCTIKSLSVRDVITAALPASGGRLRISIHKADADGVSVLVTHRFSNLGAPGGEVTVDDVAVAPTGPYDQIKQYSIEHIVKKDSVYYIEITQEQFNLVGRPEIWIGDFKLIIAY